MLLQDVQLPAPVQKGGSVTSRRLQTIGADRRPFTSGVGDFQAATGGGFWVAARESAESALRSAREHRYTVLQKPVPFDTLYAAVSTAMQPSA